jgi:hypothetical protein
MTVKQTDISDDRYQSVKRADISDVGQADPAPAPARGPGESESRAIEGPPSLPHAGPAARGAKRPPPIDLGGGGGGGGGGRLRCTVRTAERSA